MKLIQIYNSDGSEYGLFEHDLLDDDGVYDLVLELHEKSNIEISLSALDENGFDYIFENNLSEYNINRVFINEEINLPS